MVHTLGAEHPRSRSVLTSARIVIRSRPLMWALQNDTTFAAERTIVVDKHGAKHWVVVVKGTFTIHPDGSTELAKDQIPPQIEPEYMGDFGESTLRYETDLVAAKPRTDIVLNATAHAPHGVPSTEVVVGISIAGRQKALRVTGDRIWDRNLVGQIEPTPARPFVQMPIVYERAQGGWDKTHPDPGYQKMDPYNPVGVGVVAQASHRLGQPLPNLSYATPAAPGPAGFCAIGSHWQPRLALQGTYDTRWFEHQRPLLPTDYNPLALQCAPVDQQIEPHVEGGITIGLVNLTPGGALQLQLPTHHLGFRTHFASSKKEQEHDGKLDTVIIEPDLGRLMVVWRTMLACHHQIDDIDRTQIWEKRHG